LLAQAPTLSGTVYVQAAAGRLALPGATVQLNTANGLGPIIARTRTDALGRYLELDGAVRGTRNKNTGTLGNAAGESRTREFITWKLSGIWDTTDWLRVRATRSRDVRAAQFRELFETRDPFAQINHVEQRRMAIRQFARD
jgi:outer membrane receptor protein involved in Fe transport